MVCEQNRYEKKNVKKRTVVPKLKKEKKKKIHIHKHSANELLNKHSKCSTTATRRDIAIVSSSGDFVLDLKSMKRQNKTH